MKKILLTIIVSLLLIGNVFAEEIPIPFKTKEDFGKITVVDVRPMQCTFTTVNKLLLADNDQYYVFMMGENDKFILVSLDRNGLPIYIWFGKLSNSILVVSFDGESKDIMERIPNPCDYLEKN